MSDDAIKITIDLVVRTSDKILGRTEESNIDYIIDPRDTGRILCDFVNVTAEVRTPRQLASATGLTCRHALRIGLEHMAI